MIQGLSHYNLRAPRPLLEELRAFYSEVVGLVVGDRPPFQSFGYWLYAGGRDILHLTECSANESRSTIPTTFDHVAFASTELAEAEQRLKTQGVTYEVGHVPQTDQVQLFFRDPAGNGVELNFADRRDHCHSRDDLGSREEEEVSNVVERKALIRAYKESSRPMGVYQVRNEATGKWFIGTSINLPAILNRHRAQLRLGVHPNRALQDDWNEFGADAFSFEAIDTLEAPDKPDYDPAEDLDVLKEMWIERLGTNGASSYH